MEKQAVVDPAVTPPRASLAHNKFIESLKKAGVELDRAVPTDKPVRVIEELDNDVTKRLADKVETATKQSC